MCPLAQKLQTYQVGSQTTPDEHPRPRSPYRRRSLITLSTLTKFEIVWRRGCDDVLFRSACLFGRTFCATQRSDCSKCNFHCYMVSPEKFPSNVRQTRIVVEYAEVLQRARLIFSPPALSRFHLPTATTRRWPALPSLPPFDDFRLVCRCLYEALRPSSSIAGQNHRRCCLVWF